MPGACLSDGGAAACTVGGKPVTAAAPARAPPASMVRREISVMCWLPGIGLLAGLRWMNGSDVTARSRSRQACMALGHRTLKAGALLRERGWVVGRRIDPERAGRHAGDRKTAG